jgi:uncharacterized protein (TIGR03435 family)
MTKAAGVVCVSIVTLALHAQAPTFEVASVKPHANAADTNMSINDPPGGRLECSNVSLKMLITYAWDVRDYQVLNMPTSAEDGRYDIEAKPSAEDAAHEPPKYSSAANELGRKRTQALLIDRFHLKLHEEQREMAVYSLVVAKGGSKLERSVTETPFPQMSWNSTSVRCKKVTMARFAKMLLASRMNRYVIDNTGLTGEYDIHMEFQPDAPSSAVAAASAPGPTFENALEEQLGLRLVAAKGPVPFLVVDHVEKLVAN